jgi:capsular polysaccharide biosynthesis protein
MTEQIIDLRSTWAILRRKAGVLVLAGAVGAAAGGAAVYLHPPAYSSSSQVLLPPPPEGPSSPAGSHTIDTQVQIATSEAVLAPAGRNVTPALSTAEVKKRVDVEARTTDVIEITATGDTPAAAQSLAEAVAKAEVAYLEAAASTLGQDARKALEDRQAALETSMDEVTAEVQKAKARMAGKNPTSDTYQANATALGELTAQQGKLALAIDDVKEKMAAGNQPSGGAATSVSVIQHASPAERMSLALTTTIFALVGAAAGLLLVGFVLVLRGRREAALRSRDQVADAVGIPVVASIQSGTPRSVAGWTDLLRDYTPHNVEMWTLRQLVRLVTPGHPGSLAGEPKDPKDAQEAPAVIVVTLSGDGRALAVGPQLASFAASTGLTTTLVTAQSHESANALWAACSGLAPEAHPRPGLSVDSRQRVEHADDLVVHVAVVDRQRPELRVRAAEHAVTLLAVSAGVATADDLARVALAADDAQHPIARIVVVDPDPLDRTTGRLLPSERAQHTPLPSLMTGSPIAGEATALDTRRRLR